MHTVLAQGKKHHNIAIFNNLRLIKLLSCHFNDLV